MGKYTKKQIIELAAKSKTLAEMGTHLNVSRESIRQIANRLDIKERIQKILDKNKRKDRK